VQHRGTLFQAPRDLVSMFDLVPGCDSWVDSIPDLRAEHHRWCVSLAVDVRRHEALGTGSVVRGLFWWLHSRTLQIAELDPPIGGCVCVCAVCDWGILARTWLTGFWKLACVSERRGRRAITMQGRGA
jgi:hypothetical protein